MSLSKEEIIDYAARYVAPEEQTDFPHNNDVFCLMGRKIADDQILPADKGWEFNGYGLCQGYTLDDVEKPIGKWLWMHFLSLSIFPPAPQVLKLQPPHVVKGRFQNSDRSGEFKFVKVPILNEYASSKPGLKLAKTKSVGKKIPLNQRIKLSLSGQKNSSKANYGRKSGIYAVESSG